MPKLLVNTNFSPRAFKPSRYELFKFIKTHYKNRWTYLTLFNCLAYEKRLLVFPFLKSIFTSRKTGKPDFEHLKISTNKNSNASRSSIDVIIPTIGRKQYLYDVLKDLTNQTLLPKNVIIIEQNADIGSKSELDYLQTKSWPFQIKHAFINKIGACNARNMALQQIESDWVFMADDDIRFERNMNSSNLINDQSDQTMIKKDKREANTEKLSIQKFESTINKIDNFLKTKELGYIDRSSSTSVVLHFKNNYFNTGEFKLSGKVKKDIEQLYKIINNFNNNLKLEVIGHTDARKIKTKALKAAVANNLFLSKLRAQTVAQAMIKSGFKTENIETSGKGPSERDTRSVSIHMQIKTI